MNDTRPRPCVLAAAKSSVVCVLLGVFLSLHSALMAAQLPLTGLRVVVLMGEDQDETRTPLPDVGKEMLSPLGIQLTFIHPDPKDPSRFLDPEFDAVNHADLLLLSLGGRLLHPAHLGQIRAHIDAGKPIIGLRSAAYAFSVPSGPSSPNAWPRFGEEILGAVFQGISASNVTTTLRSIPETAGHPILRGINPEFSISSPVYQFRNVFRTVTPLLNAVGDKGTSAGQPVAWINSADNRKVFYTSLGAASDFKLPVFRRLLRNAVLWALDQPIPNEPVIPSLALDSASSEGSPRLGPLSPAEAAATLTPSDDLEIEQVLAEPDIAQPIHISFDERGRLWVVEYRQYPNPAGLKMISRDNFWRAVYDKVPAAPPHHVHGADRITIHEDTQGNGRYDKHTVFIDGLNIATSACRGRGGVWVLNPPYLLFYPDANNDDVPDGDPITHLAGFGLEDTHSVVNSLRWGPDGWLYGAQGSTVTANIQRPGIDKAPLLRTSGQQIWRYHPETHRFEVFSEGGGNAFGCEIDDAGRIFSGHNGGNTRGFHYMQGAYLQKGFEKHGPLSNPYAFGYFPAMVHHDAERFTHNFILYSAPDLPPRYHGRLLGVEPLQGRIVMSDIEPTGSTFKTHDLGYPVTSSDTWFRPVEIKQGPDGAVYVCDFYERQVNHYRNHEGQVDPSTGRIYRLKRKGASPGKPFDLSKASSASLVEGLGHSNKWFRQTMLRLLADRHDATVVPMLERQVEVSRGQLALESLWALHASGGMSSTQAHKLLVHPEPQVRAWTVRLLCDAVAVPEASVLDAIRALVPKETSVEVRAQIACSLRRIPARSGVGIARALFDHDIDATDPRQPLLLWWVLEGWITQDPETVLALFDDSPLWHRPLVEGHILSRLSRRLAQEGGRSRLLACAKLFEIAPDAATSRRLLDGFEAAFEGRPMESLPDRLLQAMSRHAGSSVMLGLRQGRPEAVAEALRGIGDSALKESTRLQYLSVLSERRTPEAVPTLLRVLRESQSIQTALRLAVIAAFQPLEDPSIASEILPLHNQLDPNSQIALQNLLATRPAWTATFLNAVETGAVGVTAVNSGVVRRLRQAKESAVASRVEKLWGKPRQVTPAETEVRIRDLAIGIRQGGGEPYSGRTLFEARCASCHRLFGLGNDVGPELTSYRRNDLEGLLLQILQPSAEIREGYENFELETKDDRSLTGFLIEQDPQRVVLRGVDGRKVAVDRGDITSLRAAALSLMPEGLLDSLTLPQIRDLFAYLQSTQPLVGARPGR